MPDSVVYKEEELDDQSNNILNDALSSCGSNL